MTLATTTTVHKDDLTVISAADANSWRTELPQAIDATAGGTYAPTGTVNVAGSGFGTIDVQTLCDIEPAGQLVTALGGLITDSDGQTFTLAQGQLREFDTITAQRDHYISTDGAVLGSWIRFTKTPDAFEIYLHRVGEGAAIVTLTHTIWCEATVYFDNTGVWRLLETSAGLVGAHA